MQKKFHIGDINKFRQKLVSFLRDYDTFSLLDSNQIRDSKSIAGKPDYHRYDLLAGIGVKQIINANAGNAISQLQKQWENNPCWLFGYFSYELKSETEPVSSSHTEQFGLPDLFYFEPEIIISLIGNEITIESHTAQSPEEIYNFIINSEIITTTSVQPVMLKPAFDREDYINKVKLLIDHIIEGDVYEVNLCQQFFAEDTEIEPFTLFQRLCEVSPQPFSAFMRIERNVFVLSASMERYLYKEGQKVVSQPIKGTVRRGKDPEEDAALANQLLHDEKERAENVMIVDLVRNDLSRSAIPGTVKVEELFGIYPFPQVFHMISTISAELLPEKNGFDAIRRSFPMGSMTGAPKIMAMELIEKYESSRRGVYSGALGYFTPKGNFDLSVVIRTMIYNAARQHLSIHAGSAITYDSIPEKEYDECLLKISGWKKILGE